MLVSKNVAEIILLIPELKPMTYSFLNKVLNLLIGTSVSYCSSCSGGSCSSSSCCSGDSSSCCNNCGGGGCNSCGSSRGTLTRTFTVGCWFIGSCIEKGCETEFCCCGSATTLICCSWK